MDQPNLFDIAAAEAAKEEGIKRAAEGARKEWREAALSAVKHLAKKQAWFTPDDVWRLMERFKDRLAAQGVGRTDDGRRLGAVMVEAARQDFIEIDPHGRKIKSTRPERHRGDAAVWWSLIGKETRASYIKRRIVELNPDALFADGFDRALIGCAQQFNRVLALYDRAKCIEILTKEGLSEEEAHEHFEFNVVGAYVGENTPLFYDGFVRIEDL